MRVLQLKDMKKGWFVGNFSPSALLSEDFEVGVKKYNAGDYEVSHYHRIATEITVIVEGAVKMNGNTYLSGTIVIVEPGQSTDFLAITNTITTVIKYPSIINDKYLTNT
jgi:hypothetical protein